MHIDKYSSFQTNLRSEEIHPQFQWWRRKKETMVMGRKVHPDHYRVIAPFPTMATNPGSGFKHVHDDTHANHSSLDMLASERTH